MPGVNEIEDAYEILKRSGKYKNDLLSKHLLVTEFNEVANLGLTGQHDKLQTYLIGWGEYMLEFDHLFGKDDFSKASKMFEKINKEHE